MDPQFNENPGSNANENRLPLPTCQEILNSEEKNVCVCVCFGGRGPVFNCLYCTVNTLSLPSF